MSSPTPVEQLAGLRERVQAAQRRVEEVRLRRGQSRRAVQAAREAIVDYHRALGAGDVDPDPDREQELLGAYRDAAGVLSVEAQFARDAPAPGAEPVIGGHQARVVGVEMIDPRVDAELAGAQQALEARRSELQTFVRTRLPALVAERLPDAGRVADAAREALEAAIRADGAWRAERSWWIGVLRDVDYPDLAGEIPAESGLGALPWPGDPVLPLPASLIPDPEGD